MTSKAQIRATARYKEKNIHRIGLDVQNDYFYNVLKPAVEAAGETVNGYIKKAIAERIERDESF